MIFFVLFFFPFQTYNSRYKNLRMLVFWDKKSQDLKKGYGSILICSLSLIFYQRLGDFFVSYGGKKKMLMYYVIAANFLEELQWYSLKNV